MNQNQIDKFISQCVAISPCPNPESHRMNKDSTGCEVCKLTIEELQKWETYSDEEREVVCFKILER